MKVLAIDTSSNVATAAVMDDERLICEFAVNYKKNHSQQLMPIIKNVLDSCELRTNEIDLFAVAIGPGSFTGLRIGVATVKALAHSVNKPIIGIETLDALAFSLPFYNGIVCPILDAKREQVYTALYKWSDAKSVRISDYMAISVEELLKDLASRNEDVVFLGDGTFPFKNVLQSALKEKAHFMAKHGLMQRASLVAELAVQRFKDGKVDDYMSITPFYLRKSQAERAMEDASGN